jgi:YD repeat-containing protein
MDRTRRRALIAFLVLSAFWLQSGPVTSAAASLFPQVPSSSAPSAASDDPPPRHKGGVRLSTGIYVRENDDLIVAGMPALVLRRTYISGYRASKQFGIGTTHSGEQFVIGDGERFQWASLIQASGSRIHFIRTSPGTSLFNAIYRHSSATAEWAGAELKWSWGRWVLRRPDGFAMTFRACGPTTVCSLIETRDADGRTVQYKRDSAGRLVRIEAADDRWIGFEYDAADRIALASASSGVSVAYKYDGRGRLVMAKSSRGTIRQYTYTDADELATMTEPGTTIENVYENGRVIRQINRFDDEPDDAKPLTFDFTYHLEGGDVVRTDTRRSDGIWSSFVWDDDGGTVSETRGIDGFEPVVVTYTRDPFTSATAALTVTCPDRSGGTRSHSSIVRGGNEDQVKADLIRTRCSLRIRQAPRN